jgi:hypothetical protein
MNHRTIGIFLITLFGVVGPMALPGKANAQYRCAVVIELKGAAVLRGQIRDVERPPTDELWKMLETLSFSPTKDGKDMADPKSVEQTTLKGELRVKVNGAGEVDLKELRLVRNKNNAEAWVIAPEDFTRILKMRKASAEEQPK